MEKDAYISLSNKDEKKLCLWMNDLEYRIYINWTIVADIEWW